MANKNRVEFKFQPGFILADKYRVVQRLGKGWEGEVYQVSEIETGIERTAKFFYPERNIGNRTLKRYALKMHCLRVCPMIIQYHTQECIHYKNIRLPFLVSEYVEGELLSRFIKRQKGRRLPPFTAVHLLHALAKGMETIHIMGEYHGDLHSENIIVQRFGLGFDLKLLDLYHYGKPSKANILFDVFQLIEIFYEALGGQVHYGKLPQPLKAIILGRKKSLIAKKFSSAGELREHLETLSWD